MITCHVELYFYSAKLSCCCRPTLNALAIADRSKQKCTRYSWLAISSPPSMQSFTDLWWKILLCNTLQLILRNPRQLICGENLWILKVGEKWSAFNDHLNFRIWAWKEQEKFETGIVLKFATCHIQGDIRRISSLFWGPMSKPAANFRMREKSSDRLTGSLQCNYVRQTHF